MYSRARALAAVPTARLPIVPASMPTCARALDSENSPLGREQPGYEDPYAVEGEEGEPAPVAEGEEQGEEALSEPIAAIYSFLVIGL